MLRYFHQLSKTAVAWLALACSALVLIVLALWFQHVNGYQPCKMCIYERCAVLVIVLAGLVGSLAPKSALRYIALLFWLVGSLSGLWLTLKQAYDVLNPPLFATCSLASPFPSWLPLDTWLPFLFSVTSQCSSQQWYFLQLSMPLWLATIFAAYLLIALIVTGSQFVGCSQRRRFIS